MMGMLVQVVKIREFSGHSQAVYSLCMDTADGCFYSAGADGMLVRWKLDETDGLLVARHTSAVYSLCFRHGRVISGTHGGLLSVFDAKKFELIKHLQLSQSPIFDIIDFNGKIMVATGEGKLIELDDDFSIRRQIQLSTKSLRKLELMDGALAVAGSEGVIWILDIHLDIVAELKDQAMSVFGLAYWKSGKSLISGGREATLKIYHGQSLHQTINAHLLHIHDIRINPAQTMYLTCSMDKTVKLWKLSDNTLLKVIDHQKYGGHLSSVNKILWFDKNKFISCSDDRTLKCFEIQEK
jgi:WD repeat-containing protein 61